MRQGIKNPRGPGETTGTIIQKDDHENTCIIALLSGFDKGLHMDEKIQTGLRIPEGQYKELKRMADRYVWIALGEEKE